MGIHLRLERQKLGFHFIGQRCIFPLHSLFHLPDHGIERPLEPHQFIIVLCPFYLQLWMGQRDPAHRTVQFFQRFRKLSDKQYFCHHCRYENQKNGQKDDLVVTAEKRKLRSLFFCKNNPVRGIFQFFHIQQPIFPVRYPVHTNQFFPSFFAANAGNNPGKLRFPFLRTGRRSKINYFPFFVQHRPIRILPRIFHNTVDPPDEFLHFHITACLIIGRIVLNLADHRKIGLP